MTKQQLVQIGHRLRAQRSKLELTREQFAELADIGAGYYGQIEVGTSQMSIDTLIKVSRASKLPLEFILFGESDSEPADLSGIELLLSHCSKREIHLAEQILKLFLLRAD